MARPARGAGWVGGLCSVSMREIAGRQGLRGRNSGSGPPGRHRGKQGDFDHHARVGTPYVRERSRKSGACGPMRFPISSHHRHHPYGRRRWRRCASGPVQRCSSITMPWHRAHRLAPNQKLLRAGDPTWSETALSPGAGRSKPARRKRVGWCRRRCPRPATSQRPSQPATSAATRFAAWFSAAPTLVASTVATGTRASNRRFSNPVAPSRSSAAS